MNIVWNRIYFGSREKPEKHEVVKNMFEQILESRPPQTRQIHLIRDRKRDKHDLELSLLWWPRKPEKHETVEDTFEQIFQRTALAARDIQAYLSQRRLVKHPMRISGFWGREKQKSIGCF